MEYLFSGLIKYDAELCPARFHGLAHGWNDNMWKAKCIKKAPNDAAGTHERIGTYWVQSHVIAI